MRKKSKEDKPTLEELNSAHRRSQAKRKLIQTSCIKRIKVAENSFQVPIAMPNTPLLLRWLVTVSSTFQDLEFDGSL